MINITTKLLPLLENRKSIAYYNPRRKLLGKRNDDQIHQRINRI